VALRLGDVIEGTTAGSSQKMTAGKGTAAGINFWWMAGNSSITDWWTAGNYSINEKKRRLRDIRESRDGIQINSRDHRTEVVGLLDLHGAPTVGRGSAGGSGDRDALVKGVGTARLAINDCGGYALVSTQFAGWSTSEGDASEICSTRFGNDHEEGEAEDADRRVMGVLLLPDDFIGLPRCGWPICSRYTHLARLLQGVDRVHISCSRELAGPFSGSQTFVAVASSKRPLETRDATRAWVLPARQGQGAIGAKP